MLIAHGIDLSPADTDVLHTRTEGWPAGVRMAALTLQRDDAPDAFLANFAGDDRVISDYLLAEVLDRLPARDRSFLLRTARSPTMSAATSPTPSRQHPAAGPTRSSA